MKKCYLRQEKVNWWIRVNLKNQKFNLNPNNYLRSFKVWFPKCSTLPRKAMLKRKRRRNLFTHSIWMFRLLNLKTMKKMKMKVKLKYQWSKAEPEPFSRNNTAFTKTNLSKHIWRSYTSWKTNKSIRCTKEKLRRCRRNRVDLKWEMLWLTAISIQICTKWAAGKVLNRRQ